jgi:hypothetical protein
LSEQIMSFRVGLYEAIRRTAEQQHQAVAADDLERFYDLLHERERLLEKAETVEQPLGDGDRRRAGEVVADILRLDQETERLLTGKIEEVRGELGGMAVRRQAVAAYGRVTPLR